MVVQDMTEDMVRDEGLLQTLLKALSDSLSEAVEDRGLNRTLNVEKISVLGGTRFSSCCFARILCVCWQPALVANVNSGPLDSPP